jgi:hypothetical protein
MQSVTSDIMLGGWVLVSSYPRPGVRPGIYKGVHRKMGAFGITSKALLSSLRSLMSFVGSE